MNILNKYRDMIAFQIFKCKNNILKRHKRGASTKCIISSNNKSKVKKEKKNLEKHTWWKNIEYFIW